MSVSTLARDARDFIGAASLTLGGFGLPTVLAIMALATPVLTQVSVQPMGERSASFVYTIAGAEDAVSDPATGRIDGVEATVEPPEPVVEEPAEEEVAEVVAQEPAPEEQAEEATAAVDSPDGVEADALALASATGPNAGRPRLDPSKVRVARPPGTRTAKATGTTPKKRRCEEPTEDIQKIDDSTYDIARRLVDEYVSDLEKAQTLAYVAWHRNEEGKIDGFRIRRIKCGNVLDQAGFRNGDVVHSVNGKKIRTVFGAIAAYRRLKNKEHLKVDVTSEQGEARQMRYRIS